jgi:4-alpha-glucanotransferase
MDITRRSGILLHPTSLPNSWGIGTMGPEAYWFVDRLAQMKQKLWQVLPLYPTGIAGSPYAALSAFAGNPNLISPDLLIKDGLLDKKECLPDKKFNEKRVDFSRINKHRNIIFKQAFVNFIHTASDKQQRDFKTFCRLEKCWLDDFALFMALKEYYGSTPWDKWNKDIRGREPRALNKYKKLLKTESDYHRFLQFLFFNQWNALKQYANNKNIKIIGDNPIYVAYDSADVWAHPELFILDKNLSPSEVSGVPPDCFSKTGQLWGNPIYNWKKHKETNYKWWIENLKASFALTDFVRIDHFIGFVRYWAVPYKEKTAENGKWEPGPGIDFFAAMKNAMGDLPLIAEDLGAVTNKVKEIKDTMGFPGMKILQEAFDGNPNHHFLPHNYSPNYIVYTGTHDNNTTLATYRNLSPANKKFMKHYLDFTGTDHEMLWQLIRLALSSVAGMAVIPMQDLLGLGSEARMNTPATIGNNWKWRFKKEMLTYDAIQRLCKYTEIYGR